MRRLVRRVPRELSPFPVNQLVFNFHVSPARRRFPAARTCACVRVSGMHPRKNAHAHAHTDGAPSPSRGRRENVVTSVASVHHSVHFFPGPSPLTPRHTRRCSSRRHVATFSRPTALRLRYLQSSHGTESYESSRARARERERERERERGRGGPRSLRIEKDQKERERERKK